MFESATAGLTILAPTTELAAALLDAVERRHLAAGREIWPTPRIRDLGGWLRDRHAERQLADAALPRLLGEIEERELWRSVVLDAAAGRELLEPAGAARAARQARRTMVDHGIPLGALAAYPSDETLALADWSRRFQERCRELNCIGSDALLASMPAPHAIAWVESPLWRPLARRWLESHGALRLLPEQASSPVSARFASASPAEEIAAIAGWARVQLERAPQFRAWICIPDLKLRRGPVVDAFDAALAPQRYSLAARAALAPYAVAGGTPLGDYAPVRAALTALFAAFGPLSFAHWSALLRMPELHESFDDAAGAAVLDIALRSRGPAEASLREWLQLADASAVAQPVAALRRLASVLRILDAPRGRHRLSRWVSVWVEAFEAGPWAHRQRWSSTEFQAAERLRELLAALAMADALFGPQSGSSAAGILQRAAADTMFQPQTGVPPIGVSGQLMDPWLAYDGLWIAGCSEERWPPPPDPVPLLPVGLQREYGVVPASAQSQRWLAEDLQRRWRARARSSVFSCADPGDGRSMRWSPLLSALPDAGFAQAPTQPHWRARLHGAPQLERLIDETAPPFAQSERTRGVSTLRAQARCAFRGFAETRLRAEALELPIPGFNARERGNLLHHALEFIWSELRTSARLEAISAAARSALVSTAAERAIAVQCERRDPGSRWRRREHSRLTRLLDKWLDIERLRAPFEVLGVEPGAQMARHGGLEFRVRIDRIDRLADGARVLIDYKTGLAVADWRGERPDNPQLPIYALLQPHSLIAVAYGRVNASECSFVAESERSGVFKPGGRPTAMEGMPSFETLIAQWSRRIERIAAEFAAGHAEVAPTLRACESCTFQALCRVPT